MPPSLVLLLLVVAGRLYHPVAIGDFPRSTHTHVVTRGTVTLVKREADGDLHVRLSDGPAFVVAEVIPDMPFPRPRVGTCVEARGIRRYDNEGGHGWFEVHPVLAPFKVVACPKDAR